MKQRHMRYTHNSCIILSKLTTANRREAIAAPEMSNKAMIRRSDAVLVTVVGDRPEGSGMVVGMANDVDRGVQRESWQYLGLR